jgi:lipid-A-disaccharide synthase-like uncharacterized protein
MNETLFTLPFFGTSVVITAWKLIGYAGVLCFGSRWLFQLVASHRNRKPTFPLFFWLLSLSGSLLLLSYFIFGKNDSVGVLSNLMPAGVAGYNLFLHLGDVRRSRATGLVPPAKE